MTPRTKAIITRFAVILLTVELPIITVQLQSTAPFDWRLVLAALLAPIGAALEKAYSPQLADTILPGAHIAAVPIVIPEPHPLDTLVPDATPITPEIAVVPPAAPH